MTETEPETPFLDPQITKALADAAAAGIPSADKLPLEEARANYAKLCKEQFGPVDEVFTVEHMEIQDVPVRIYRPVETDEPSMALVYFHGGGWVLGSVETHDGIARALAKRAGIVVISVDYRLAPEHPFPQPLEDCWNVARWVWENAAELGIDQDHIGVGGDSAGGTLATVVAYRGRDIATPFALQLLLYPVTSLAGGTPSWDEFATGYGLTAETMRWYWAQYVGDAEDLDNADLSPALARDTRRVPRAVVVTAECDILRDEAETYAQRLALSGIEVEGYRYDGMVHGFLRMAGIVDRSQQALTEIAESVKGGLAMGWRDSFTGH